MSRLLGAGGGACGDGNAADSAEASTRNYTYGVICALVGASLQAVGLQLWKLHYLRVDRQAAANEEEPQQALPEAGDTSIQASPNADGVDKLAGEMPLVLSSSPELDQRLKHMSRGSEPAALSHSVQYPSILAGTGPDFLTPRRKRQRRGHHSRSHSQDSNFSAALSSSHSETADMSLPVIIGSPAISPQASRHNVNDTSHPTLPAPSKSYMPSCLWLFGFTVFLVGNVLDFLALGLTKVSIVTLVGSGSLVVNTVMARLLLKETVTVLDVTSAALIILGISLTVVGNRSGVKDWCLDMLIAQYKRSDVTWMLIILSALIGACFAVMFLDWSRRKANSDDGVLAKPPRGIRAVTCIVGALVATYTILFGKAFSGLILLTLGGDNQFTDIFTVVIVAVFLVSLPTQLVLINMSLAVNDALMHIPNFYVFWNLGSIISGAIFYQELAELEAKDLVIFFLGVLVLIVAVTLTNVSGARKQKLADELAALAEAETEAKTGKSTERGAGSGQEAVDSLTLSGRHERSSEGVAASSDPVSYQAEMGFMSQFTTPMMTPLPPRTGNSVLLHLPPPFPMQMHQEGTVEGRVLMQGWA